MATVKQIRADLAAAGVEIPKGAKKADLEELLAGVSGPAPEPAVVVEEGGIDPRLVEAREAARAREGRAPRVRPVPARIDPRLVEERKRVRDEEVRNRARSARETPAR